MSVDIAGERPTLVGRRILITGGAGFIGSHLANALADDNEVLVLDNLSTGSRERVSSEVSFKKGDVRDRGTVDSAVSNTDVIFHEAGMVSVSTSTQRPVDSQTINVGGTLRVLDAARREGARVVVASSAAVYGHPNTIPINEDSALTPMSPYGVDKLAIDHYTRLFADLYGLPTVALRYFNVYGPGQPGEGYSGVISTFLRQATAGDPLTIHGDGSQTRDFVHVQDVVDANIRAAKTPHTGRAFNVGTGRATEVETLARAIKQVSGCTSPLVYVDSRPGDIDASVADLTNAKECLRYEPSVELSGGLATIIHEAKQSEQES